MADELDEALPSRPASSEPREPRASAWELEHVASEAGTTYWLELGG